MDYNLKQKLLNRVFSAEVFCKTSLENPRFVLFKHPLLLLKLKLDQIYDISYDLAIGRRMFSECEALEVATTNNIWSKHHECDIENIKKYIEKLDKDLDNTLVKYQGPLLDETKKKKSNAEIKLAKLKYKRDQIVANTAEKFAETKKHEFLTRQITYLDDGSNLFEPKNHHIVSEYNQVELIAKLAQLYFVDSVLKESQIRLLARSNPWRLYYNPARHIGFNVFNRLPQDYTDEQISLLYWSSIYDYAFESSNRPEQPIIDDDIRFDKWLDDQDKKDNKKYLKIKLPESRRKGVGTTEVFIPCSPDMVEEVEKLNSPLVQIAKKKFLEKLNKKGTMSEIETIRSFAGVIT